MTEIVHETRAKSGWIEVKRKDKGGRTVKARDEMITSQGMMTAKEMERELETICEEKGYSTDQIRMETFQHGDAPIEANPRHRGLGHRWEKRPTEEVDHKPKVFQKVRTQFTGWSPPTPEELAAFEAAKENL
jgi:hypothetical protein